MTRVEATDREFPRHFAEFQQIVDPKLWFDIHRNITNEIKGKPFLKHYLSNRNRVAVTLVGLSQEFSRFNTFHAPLIHSPVRYETCVLVMQFVDHYSRSSASAKIRLKQRFVGAMKNNVDDLRGLQFECLVGVHLAKKGYSIAFPEETGGSATNDIRATKDAVTIDVECKSISGDTGRKIPERDALELNVVLQHAMQEFAKNLTHGLVVRAVVPERLPTAHTGRLALRKRIVDAMLAGQSVMADDLDVHICDFDVAQSPFRSDTLDRGELGAFLAKNFGIRNQHIFCIYHSLKQALVFSIESRDPDVLLDRIFRTISHATKQLPGTHPGIVGVKFEGLSAADLEMVGTELGPATALRREASNFLGRHRQSHLVCLSFLSAGAVGPTEEVGISQQGTTYFFENPESPVYTAAAVEVFRGSLGGAPAERPSLIVSA